MAKKSSTHSFEIDFVLSSKGKIIPIEVKSSAINNHASINEFAKKYSGIVGRTILFSQKDVAHEQTLELKPLYLAPVIIGEL